MKSEFRHAYLQYVGVRVGGHAIGIDYEATVYWGQVIEIAQNALVTLKYYAGEGYGYKTETFHPYRCVGDLMKIVRLHHRTGIFTHRRVCLSIFGTM